MSVAARGAVFLSYASQDAEAARRICDALRAAGVEVWFDRSELRGGDAWDAKIRKQIRDCALFMPIISTNTQARPEGYFRLEWKLADRRTDLIGKSKAFLVPVCIDETGEADADVPDSFLAVQWTRLAGGHPPPEFCPRVHSLLNGDAAPLRHSAGPIETATVTSPAGAPPAKTAPAPRRWLPAAIIVGGVVMTVTLWAPWRKPHDALGVPPKTAESAAVAEAHRLIAKADALFDQDELAPRESLAAAEKFCQQAVGLAPGDAESWAVLSRVASHYIFLTYDRSQDRRAQAGDAATRAVRLAPTSYEARYALAYFYRLDEASYPEAERMLRKLLEERPGDKRVWRTLGSTLRYATIFAGAYRGRDAEAAECFRRAAALPGGDPLSLHFLATDLASLGETAESERAMAACIQAKPAGSALLQRTNLLIRYLGDVPRAREALAAVPVDQMREDFGTFIAAQVWWCSRDPDKMIAVLRALPRDYMEAVVDGPKGFFIGQAHRMAGRAQAAEIEWRAALQVVERRLTAQPNYTRLLLWKAWLWALLGDHAEARRCFQAAEQLGLTVRDAYWAAGIPLELGDTDKAVALLTTVMNNPVVTTRAFLRIDPTWDRLRADPRFEALVADPKAARSAAEQKSVAVLAFKSISADRESEIFSEGVSEELLNVLAKVSGLRVAARASAFYFKDKNATAQEMGQKLNVGYLVEGSVQRDGAIARVNARLSRADTGEQVWSQKFDGELRNILTLQDQIAERIAENLKLKLGYAPRVDRTVDPEAFRLMLEGRYYWNQRSEHPEEVLARAMQAHQKALAIDPGYAEAHAGLGDVWVTRGLYRSMDGRGASAASDYAEAKKEARKALELNAALAEPHVTLAYVDYCERNFAGSEQHYAQAFALNPNYALAHHWHSLLMTAAGRLDESLLGINQALRLDPLSANTLWSATVYHNHAELLTEALSLSDRELALRPGLVPIHSERALIFLKLGRKAEAVASARLVTRDLNVEPRWWADGDALHVLRRAGLEQEAAAAVERALAKFPQGDYRRGFVLAAMGRIDEAMAAIESVPAIALSRLYVGPMWDPWREDPRFKALLAKLGCEAEYAVAQRALARLRKEGGK